MRSYLFPFTPIPTTLLALTTYIIITTVLLAIHFVPPRNIPPQSRQNDMKISVVDAWHDLQHITRDWGYHPYNSHANDRVKEYLIERIHEILRNNKIGVEAGHGNGVMVQVVDDTVSNITFAAEVKGVTVYYEGTNFMVIVKGMKSVVADDKEEEKEKGRLGAVLVNAHYDSVSTGYGATDDGAAVVTLLQLISYFTNPDTPTEQRPRRDIMFLFNNGEEDYLVSGYGWEPIVENYTDDRCRMVPGLLQ